MQQPTDSPIKLGLSRTQDLLQRLGNPETSYKTVHVTGTNGKGSVVVMVSSVLHACGYKVGRFTSPWIRTPMEGIVIGEKEITRDMFESTKKKVVEMNEMEPKIGATEFEVMTCIAFSVMKEMRVEIAVIEVGMGGEGDATNVIPAPLVSVLTRVGLDHVDMLGGSVESIARNKVGIVKTGCVVVVGEQGYDVVESIVRERAEKMGCRIEFAKRAEVVKSDRLEFEKISDFLKCWKNENSNLISDKVGRQDELDLDEWYDGLTREEEIVVYREVQRRMEEIVAKEKEKVWMDVGGKRVFVEKKLRGDYQLENIGVVCSVLSVLEQIGYAISEGALVSGMERVAWDGRLEFRKMKRDRLRAFVETHMQTKRDIDEWIEMYPSELLVVVDGSHNVDGSVLLGKYLNELRERVGGRMMFVFGISRGKDVDGILKSMQIAKRDGLTCMKFSGKEMQPWIASGVISAKEKFVAGIVVVCGSLYLQIDL